MVEMNTSLLIKVFLFSAVTGVSFGTGEDSLLTLVPYVATGAVRKAIAINHRMIPSSMKCAAGWFTPKWVQDGMQTVSDMTQPKRVAKCVSKLIPKPFHSITNAVVPNFVQNAVKSAVKWDDPDSPRVVTGEATDRLLKFSVDEKSQPGYVLIESGSNKPGALTRQNSQAKLTKSNTIRNSASLQADEVVRNRLCRVEINAGGADGGVLPYKRRCIGYLMRIGEDGPKADKTVGTFGLITEANCFYAPPPEDPDAYIPDISKVIEQYPGNNWLSFVGDVTIKCGQEKVTIRSNRQNDIVRIPPIFGRKIILGLEEDQILQNIAIINLSHACKAKLFPDAARQQKFSNFVPFKFYEIQIQLEQLVYSGQNVKCAVAGYQGKQLVFADAATFVYKDDDTGASFEVVKFLDNSGGEVEWGPVFCHGNNRKMDKKKWVLASFAPFAVGSAESFGMKGSETLHAVAEVRTAAQWLTDLEKKSPFLSPSTCPLGQEKPQALAQ